MPISIPITLSGRKPFEIPKPNPIMVGDMNYQQAFDWMKKQDVLVLDIETNGLSPHENDIILIQIGNADVQYIFHYPLFSKKELLANAIATSEAIFVGHLLKFDLGFIYKNMGVVPQKIWDTFTYEQLVTKDFIKSDNYSYELKGGVAFKYLNKRFSTAARSEFIDADPNKVVSKSQLAYAATDIVLTYCIYIAQFYGVMQHIRGGTERYCVGYQDMKKALPGFSNTVTLEMNFVSVMAKIEVNGFKLDKNIWIKESNKAAIQLGKMEVEILEELERLEIITSSKSNKQQVLLGNDDGGIRHIIMRKSGKKRVVPLKLKSTEHVVAVMNRLGFTITSSHDEVLKTIDHPIAEMIRVWRGLDKIVTSYGANIVKFISPTTGRIHANFDPYYASGRITPREPNLANIPRPKKDLDLRKAFICEPGYKIITVDMSAAEVRIIAELCEDAALIKSLNDGIDPHKFIASAVYKVDYDKVTKEQRTTAKKVLFGYAYGAGPATVARQAEISYKDAVDFIEVFNKEFPSVQKFFSGLHKKVLEDGYVSTIGGRPRIFDIPSRQLHYEWSPLERREFEASIGSICRAAGNHPIQGTNADAIKRSMILLQRHIDKNNIPAKIVNVVHDELVVEAREDIAEEFAGVVSEIMTKAQEFYVKKVPVSTSVIIDDRWAKD